MNSVNLGELEKQVMEVIWAEEKCSTRDILVRLTPRRNLAYTTVATILNRLHMKGLLKQKKTGNRMIYMPAISKTEYSNSVVRSFINNVTASFGEIALTSFADGIEHLPRKKRDKLLRLLNKVEDG